MNKRIMVCGGTGCVSSGSPRVADNFEKELHRLGMGEKVVRTGCHGFCEQGPLVVIQPEGVLYCQVSAEDVPEIVKEQLGKGRIVERLLYEDPVTGKKAYHYQDISFYQKQTRFVLHNCGEVDPENIEDYLQRDGYQGLQRVLSSMKPEEVIDFVKTSGLKGRGGGGFPTGLKWELTRRSPGGIKYLICNADEGDPGAFMDRSILEGDPHTILEGMAIAGYTIGARIGYIYIRAEYPLAIKRLVTAISQAEDKGFLGKNILYSGFDFEVRIKQGAGAFVCGEETAMINSIQGNRGMPRPRPPYPAVKGLWDRPTNINNVETLANIPFLIRFGPEKFASMGTKESKGTKVFALTGKVKNTGLVEVPLGTTLREIIFDIGGGIKDNKQFKGVLIGGPSGGCLSKEFLDRPVDYDLVKIGAMMGSGGLVVLDETTCVVELARYFLTFTSNESCGKCTPCREGTTRLLEILDRIVEGKGEPGDLDRLESLSQNIIDASLCGLGQSAPNPVLASLRYFRPEYEMHVQKKVCPAGVCKNLLSFKILAEKCKACGLCLKNCPVGAITGAKRQPHQIDPEKCDQCGLCLEKCPFQAIIKG
ncbi:MAG TPA: NADH-quinone oxidoreductase subunit NuoF [Clostridia bacterium]|nr:NADH-quinone oxidoreductase subunit NuoF [Clostridia bacterium]